MTRRHITVGDRHEAGQSRFRREQVVATGIETTLVDAIADRKQLALRIEEKIETHLGGQAARGSGQRVRDVVSKCRNRQETTA